MKTEYRQQIEDWFADKRDPFLRDVARLVRVRSVKGEAQANAPFGVGPAAALDEALALCSDLGLSARDYDRHVGEVTLATEKDSILHVLGHLDVVDEGSGWTVTEPYAPRLVDGMIYGRGTDDDKGPIVAVLYAMKAVQELGLPLKHGMKLIMGTDEESGSADIAYYYSKEPFAPYSFTPDAAFPVTNVEKGSYKPTFTMDFEADSALPRVASFHGGVRINVLPGEATAEIAGMDAFTLGPLAVPFAQKFGVTFASTEIAVGTRIRCIGKSAHASTPEEGVNAITALLAFLASLPLADCGSTRAIRSLAELFPHGDFIGSALGIAQSDDVSGSLTVAFSLLDMDETHLTGRFDARIPVCATEENCRVTAERALRSRGFSVSGELEAPHHTPADGPFIRTLLDCYEAYTGNSGECQSTGGGTYVHNIPGGVAFGCGMPGFQSNLHGPDEHACLEDLLTSSKLFAQVILELCGPDSSF